MAVNNFFPNVENGLEVQIKLGATSTAIRTTLKNLENLSACVNQLRLVIFPWLQKCVIGLSINAALEESVYRKEKILDVDVAGDAEDSKQCSTLQLTTNSDSENSKSQALIYWTTVREILTGHAPRVTQILSYNQSSLLWFPLILAECILRSISNVALASNPTSGLIILIAMFIATPSSTVLALVSLSSGIVTSLWLIRIPLDLLRSGSITFNSFVLGILIGEFASPTALYDKPDILLISVAAGAIVIVCWGGLHGILTQPFNLPLLNAPFNFMALLYITSGLASRYQAATPGSGISFEINIASNSNEDQMSYNNETKNASGELKNISDFNSSFAIIGNDDVGIPINSSIIPLSEVSNISDFNASFTIGNEDVDIPIHPSITPYAFGIPETSHHPDHSKPNVQEETIIWLKVFRGVLFAPNQIFGTNSSLTAAFVYLAILIYSPIMCTQALLGATIGTIMGVGLSESYTMIYNGGWAYNPFLTSAALGGYFLIFNYHSWIIACIGSVLSTLVYAALEKGGRPILGLPFMMITWLILPAIFNHTHENNENEIVSPAFCQAVSRVPLSEVTTPELHRESNAKYSTPKANSIGPA